MFLKTTPNIDPEPAAGQEGGWGEAAGHHGAADGVRCRQEEETTAGHGGRQAGSRGGSNTGQIQPASVGNILQSTE